MAQDSAKRTDLTSNWTERKKKCAERPEEHRFNDKPERANRTQTPCSQTADQRRFEPFRNERKDDPKQKRDSGKRRDRQPSFRKSESKSVFRFRRRPERENQRGDPFQRRKKREGSKRNQVMDFSKVIHADNFTSSASVPPPLV